VTDLFKQKLYLKKQDGFNMLCNLYQYASGSVLCSVFEGQRSTNSYKTTLPNFKCKGSL